MERIIRILEELISDGKKVMQFIKSEDISRSLGLEKTKRWSERCKNVLSQELSGEESTKFGRIGGQVVRGAGKKFYAASIITNKASFLFSLKEDIENNPAYWRKKLENANDKEKCKETTNAIDNIVKICERFHAVVKQLKERREDRETLKIRDEYDVQDLFSALLKLNFDDVRREEWTPSHAGKSSRMDIILKDDRIVIETKKTRKNLLDGKIGDELIIDIEHYKLHPNCGTLVCFIYDPDELLKNAKGLENDLSREEERLSVITIVTPKK